MVCSIIIFMGHPEAHGHFRAGKERQGKGQCVCTLPLNCFSAVQRGMKSTGEMQSRGRLIWAKSRVKASSQDGLAHVCLVKMALCSVTCDSLWLHGLQHTRLLCPWNSPGKNTGVVYHALLQGIFLTQGSNPYLLYCRQILYPLSHLGSPHIGLYLPFSCHISLVSFSLGKLFCSFLVFMTMTILNNVGHLFCRMLFNLGLLSEVSSGLDSGYTRLAEVMCPFQCLTSGGIWSQLVLIWGWYLWSLEEGSICQDSLPSDYYFFLLTLIYVNISLLLKLSTTVFRFHRWFLPESISHSSLG